MGLTRGIPVHPEVVFVGSGDRAVVLEHTPITKAGKDMLRLMISVPETVLWRYKIKDKDLSYEVAGEGTIEREVPASAIDSISTNPQDPFWLIWTDFYGRQFSPKNEKYWWIQQRAIEIEALKAENKRLRAEIESERAEKTILIENTLRWKIKTGTLFDSADKVTQILIAAQKTKRDSE